MKIKNLSFITPLTSTNKIVLEKEYSKTFTLSDGSNIDIASNIGPKANQQDSISISENKGYLLMLVADGMGGLKKGEEASYIIAQLIKIWLELQSTKKLKKLNERNLEEIITELIIYAKDNILPDDAGTTLNMSLIGPKKTLIVNVGDSRTYSIKNREIKLITRDDSLAFRIFIPKTAEERDELRFFKRNNIITNAITKDTVPVVVVTTLENKEYDILCHVTDGVSDILSEDIIRMCCLNSSPAESLINKATCQEPIYNPHTRLEFNEYIYPHDNASAIVYTKKKK